CEMVKAGMLRDADRVTTKAKWLCRQQSETKV
ncbi:unnamed protein product, partial [marine sediment metagenome]